jgi:ankyrin repeat protein
MKQRGGLKLFGMEIGRFGSTGDGLRTQLFTLIDTGTKEEFIALLPKVVDKYTIDKITNKAGIHLLTYACIKNKLDIVKILKDNRADFSIVDADLTHIIDSSVLRPHDRALYPSFSFILSSNESPFLAAINTRNLELVTYLVENKVNIFVSKYNIGPLAIALYKNSAIFDYLFEIYKRQCPSYEFANLLSESIKAACEKLDEDRLLKLFENGAKLQGTTSRFLPDSSVAEILFDKKHTEAEIRDATYLMNEGYNAASDNETNNAERVLKEKDNTEAQISAILNILINNGLDVNYKAVGKFLDGTFLDQRNLLSKALSRIERNKDGQNVNNFIAKILIANGAQLLQYIKRDPEINAYYNEAQKKPATMHLRSTMSGLGLPPAQVGAKRTRRARARGRKTRRRK